MKVGIILGYKVTRQGQCNVADFLKYKIPPY